jgi:hypothetical protein
MWSRTGRDGQTCAVSRAGSKAQTAESHADAVALASRLRVALALASRLRVALAVELFLRQTRAGERHNELRRSPLGELAEDELVGEFGVDAVTEACAVAVVVEHERIDGDDVAVLADHRTTGVTEAGAAGASVPLAGVVRVLQAPTA